MSFGSHQSDERLSQVRSIESSEQLWSVLFFTHTGTLLVGCFVAAIIADAWWIVANSVLYVFVFTAEKSLAKRVVDTQSPSFYPLVLAVLSLRSVIYCALVVTIWSMEGDQFKFGSMALLVAAAINIMVFHATYFPIIVCTVMPMWGAFVGIVFLFVWDTGLSVPSILAIIIAFCVTPYLLLAVYSVYERSRLFEKAERTLDQSHRQDLLGRLVAGVAHDFSNILSVSHANAEMILGDNRNGKTKRYAEEIMRASDRGASLVEQLLSFGRHPELSPTTHEVSDILSDFRSMITRVFPKSISVTTKVADDTSTINVDRNQLEIALLNLAVNARDAMPDGGRLDLVVDSIVLPKVGFEAVDLRDGSYCRFTLHDNGSGISDEVQKKMFDPFFTTKDLDKGYGLGLSMVKRFISEIGGTVMVESGIDQGTSMTLVLPNSHEPGNIASIS